MVKCALCGSENIERIETNIRNVHSADVKVYQCLVCGVQFLSPQLSEQELMVYYSDAYRKEYVNKDYYSQEQIQDFFQKSLPEARSRAARVKQYLRSTDAVAEIGCSSGYFLEAVQPFVGSVAGTEWDEQNARYAIQQGFAVKPNIQDFARQFDKIFMYHVLEHIKDPVAFLQELKKHLVPGGLLFVEVPNNSDILLTGYKIPEFKDFYYQSAHLWYFNKASLNYVFTQAGYKLELMPVQRYDLSNHIHWLKARKPGGQAKYTEIFTDACNAEYVNSLIRLDMTDTLFAIGTINM